MHKLDLFILTYNRADYLRETLQNITEQTFNDYRVIILDNASTDHTREVVREFEVDYRPTTENIGGIPNFLRIRELAEADWVMGFHDDDLMHPHLLEVLFRQIEKRPDCALAASNFESVTVPDPATLRAKTLSEELWDFRNAAHLASFFLTHNTVGFNSCLYRREAFQHLDAASYAKFGKIADRPLMLDLCREGSAFIMKAPYIAYRTHAGQDSAEGPTADQIIALTRYYREHTGTRWSTPWGRSFIVNNRAFLKNLYKWCCERDTLSFNALVSRARKAGAATPWARVPRPLMRLVKKYQRRRDPLFF